jgi:hypothetical protein
MGKSETPFTYYAFRFDIDWRIDSPLLNQLKSYIISEFPKYSIFQEISDIEKKPHLQGKIGKALSRQQVIKNIKKAFKDTFVGSNYCIAEIKEPEKYDSYFCKSNNIFMNNIFTQSQIDYFNEIYESVKHELENNHGVKIKQSKSKTFLQKVVYEFNQQHYECVEILHHYHVYNWNLTEDEKSKTLSSKITLLKHLMKMLGSNGKVFDTNILQRMYNGIYNSIIQQNEDAANHYLGTLIEKIIL